MGRVACESRLPFFCVLATDERRNPAFIYQYKKMKFNQNVPSKKNLMVIHLFVEKAVPLYIKEREILTTKNITTMAKTKKETNIEVLIYGLNHIAENHNTTAITENWEEELQVCVMQNNVPTMCDIRMLCEDLGIPRNCIYETMFGIDIELPYEWVTKTSKETFNGCRYWERRC